MDDTTDERTAALAIIGGGNMGAALLGGILAAGAHDASEMAVVEVDETRRGELASRFPGVAVRAAVPRCDAALVAVKPNVVADAVALAVAAGARRILSIAAGVSLEALDAAAGVEPTSTGGRGPAVVRAMPNTPALVGEGASAICGGAAAGGDDLAWAETLLGAVGTVDRLPEPLLDAFTGVAGSGPAYVFLVAEALVDAAVAEGLARPVAERVVSQLLVGSAALLRQEGDAPRLRAQVTSPGGTTAAGLAALERAGVRAGIADAVRAATERSRSLR
jgi:pyrroline-5-carboxylate reductase